MNLVIAPKNSIRLSSVYRNGMLYIPCYETGWTKSGKAEVETCGLVFYREDDVSNWVEKNRKNFTNLQVATAKLS